MSLNQLEWKIKLILHEVFLSGVTIMKISMINISMKNYWNLYKIFANSPILIKRLKLFKLFLLKDLYKLL